MAARRRSPKAAFKSSSSSSTKNSSSAELKKDDKATDEDTKREKAHQLVVEHLPPIPLVFVVLGCSGLLWLFALRDFMATGRVIAGVWDEAMLVSATVFFSSKDVSYKSRLFSRLFSFSPLLLFSCLRIRSNFSTTPRGGSLSKVV